jgi:serine O-acetyltransferase
MKFSEFRFLILSDLYRYKNGEGIFNFINEYVCGTSFRYIFWFRVCQYLMQKGPLAYFPRLLSRILLKQKSIKFGVDISLSANIGPGLKIEHFGGIFINGKAQVGMRCSILHDVTIGEYGGAPNIGDFVFIGPGAKLIGGVRVGDNVIIGANSVITKDIPDHAVVVGIPGKVISKKGNLRGKEKELIWDATIKYYKTICPRSIWRKYGF